MAHKATITFYNITSCGYYKRKPRASSTAAGTDGSAASTVSEQPAFRQHVFGDIESFLNQLSVWGQSQSLADTCTFQPTEESSILPPHLADVSHLNGGWLVTIWNRTHETDGVPALAGGSTVGKAQVRRSKIQPGDLPGFATYFWLLPAQGLLATVTFEKRYAGLAGFVEFMKGFLRHYSSHVVISTNKVGDEERTVFSYRENPSGAPQKLVPSFHVRPVHKPGDIEYLREHVRSIRKLIRKDVLVTSEQDERANWQRLLSTLGIKRYQPAGMLTALNFETEISLSLDDLDEIISDWSQNEASGAYGFLLRGETTPRWLHSASVRGEYELNLQRGNDDLLAPQGFLTELARQQPTITSILP